MRLPMPAGRWQAKGINQNDYSNDTSYLYTKNVSKALLEQTLNRIGGKYGASHLGTAAITGSGALNDYLQGKSAEEIFGARYSL